MHSSSAYIFRLPKDTSTRLLTVSVPSRFLLMCAHDTEGAAHCCLDVRFRSL